MSNQIPQQMSEAERLDALPYSLPKKLTDILDDFKWANKVKNTTAVMILDGRSGMGKSTLAFQIGQYCDPSFGLDKIYFTPDTLLEGLSNAQPCSVHIFDEAMLLSGRNAMSQWNKTIVQAMSMIRSKRIIVIFCVNSVFDLDKNLALSRADILLNVYGDSLVDRGKFMAFFKGADGQDRLKMLYLLGKKYYDYSKPKSNFNAEFGRYFAVNEKEYEAKKQRDINNFLQGNTKGYGKNLAQKSRNRYIKWIKANTNLSVKEIAAIGEMGESMIYNVLGDEENDR